MGSGERCRLPLWGMGRSPSRQMYLVHIGSQKVYLLWQQFLLIFLRKKCNFLHKNKLDIVRRVQFFTAAPYEEFSSWGSRHHCPVEVGAYGPKIYFSLVLSCAWLTSREDNHASEFRAAPHCSETVIRLCTECLQGAQKL